MPGKLSTLQRSSRAHAVSKPPQQCFSAALLMLFVILLHLLGLMRACSDAFVLALASACMYPANA
jgi:hypothetical protein